MVSASINLKEIIENSRTSDEIIDKINRAAQQSGKFEDLKFAAAMKRAHILTSDPAREKKMVRLLNSINEGPVQNVLVEMRQEEQKERLRVMKAKNLEWYDIRPRTVTGSCRKKSLYSTAIKILLLQEEARQALLNGEHPREDFPNDIYACRFIVEDNGDVESIGHCYNLMNQILTFLLVEKGCNLTVTSGTVKTSEFDHMKHSMVLLPTEDMGIFPELKLYVKDYFADPKGNAYQALHACVTDVETGFVFEIQITTRTAFNYVNDVVDDESGAEVNEDNVRTSHNWHKNQKYGKIYEQQGVLDLTKIRMNGFYFNPETREFKDTICLIHSGVLPSYLM